MQITQAIAGEPDADGNTTPVPLSQITKATLLDFVEARRQEERASSTILNDLTAWTRVLAYADVKTWVEHSVAKAFDRFSYVGTNETELCPPTDDQVDALIAEVGDWSADMSVLIRWLRETGMRLAEALQLQAENIHPDRQQATLKHGVKRGKVARSIWGERGPCLTACRARGGYSLGCTWTGRSYRYATASGGSSAKGAKTERPKRRGRDAEALLRFRLHDQRHAVRFASVIDDDTCVYRLMDHLGHASVKTTELHVDTFEVPGRCDVTTAGQSFSARFRSAQAALVKRQPEAAGGQKIRAGWHKGRHSSPKNRYTV